MEITKDLVKPQIENSSSVNYAHLASHLPFLPNEDQEKALRRLGNFLDNEESRIFVLKGSAGTGKTTLAKAILKGLEEREQAGKLAALTGRAAGILCDKTGYPAQTIHKLIYQFDTTMRGDRWFAA